MKKLLLKIYGANFLLSIALYFVYRFFFIKSGIADNWVDKVLDILDIFLNIQFSAIFLIVAIFGSLTFFLNLNGHIRNNYILSLLAFLGIPLICFIFLVVTFFPFLNYDLDEYPLTTVTAFTAIYLLLNIGEFLIFRREQRKYLIK